MTHGWCTHDQNECYKPQPSHIKDTTADNPQGRSTCNLHFPQQVKHDSSFKVDNANLTTAVYNPNIFITVK